MNTQNKDLEALNKLLRKRNHAKQDIVASSANMFLDREGEFVVSGSGDGEIYFSMSKLFETQLSDKLGIPLPYFNKMKKLNPELLQHNVNGWLKHEVKNYLVRGLVGEGTTVNIGRAFLSDSYHIIDDLKVLETVQKTFENSKSSVYIDSWEITENRLYLTVLSEETYNGVTGGFTISNSETGQGAFEIQPRCVMLETGRVLVANNTGFRKIHLGKKMKVGKVSRNANDQPILENQISLAIKDFLNPAHITTTAALYNELCEYKLKYPIDALQNTFKYFSIPEELRLNVIAEYMQHPNRTAGDLFNCISGSVSQMEPDARFELESNLITFLFKSKNYDKPY